MLSENLKILLATSYAFVIKAQNFHWNVEGSDFPQYHAFFDAINNEVYENAIDRTAEYIRTLEAYTPGSISRYAELSLIPDQLKIPRAELMFQELYRDNEIIIKHLNECYDVSEAAKQYGISNFIAERLDAHNKHQWMIRSTLKTSRE
jgi:starvation-inducible DNA-binding protein|tara:strand:- start:1207 stop:1650 length:444 start_codon:yes stop_codon:yes gene_type:complete